MSEIDINGAIQVLSALGIGVGFFTIVVIINLGAKLFDAFFDINPDAGDRFWD